MVHITKMQMKGFKSFGNKTEILFGNQFNCVLGPNGSGKSNILDALCFVLGKAGAKGLRAEKSANLIYNGGKSKKPAKEGEVSIWFSNPQNVFGYGGSEIKITRIIKGSGQSVYKINDKTLTRQQVLELMSRARINPDGYNIVLQGDIVGLVEMSALERRRIVEEISGIGVYEEKKEKALRELNRVEERLGEAEIILAERHAYLKELKTERDQALKFKELDDKIKRNKATLLHKTITDHKDAADKIKKRIDEAKKKAKVYQDDIENLRKEIAKHKKKIEEINHEVEEKGEKEQVALHKEVESLKVDVAVNKQRVISITAELEKLKARKIELEKNYGELSSRTTRLQKNQKEIASQIKNKEKEIVLIDNRIKGFKKKNKMEDATDLDRRIEQIDNEAESLIEQTGKLREQQQELLREKDKLEIRLQGIDEKISKVLGLKKEHREQLDKLKGLKEQFKKATLGLSGSLNKDSSLAAQIANARSKLLSRQEELNKLQARSVQVREHLGGSAISSIMDLKLKGVHGIVSELGTVKKDYALALEVAAGARLRSIVVDDDGVAAKGIAHLKKNRQGVASFLPLNKIKSPSVLQGLPKGKGIHGLAVELLSYDKKYQNVFAYVFGNTLVVDDVETARRLGIGKARMVTLGGDLMETSGAMHGGYRHKGRGLGFQEKELTAGIDKLHKEIDDQTAIIERLTREKQTNETIIDRLREEKAGAEGEIIKLEKSLHLDSDDIGVSKDEKKDLDQKLKKASEEYDLITENISEQNRLLAKCKMEKQQLRDQMSTLRSPQLLAELNSFEEKKGELREQITKLTVELKSTDAEMANILGPEGENIQRILKQHAKEESAFEQEKEGLGALIRTQEKELASKEKMEKKFYNQFKELFNERSKLTDKANKAEQTIMTKNEHQRKEETQANIASLEQAKIKAELSGYEEEFKQYKNIELFTNKSIEMIKREIAQFERMVADIGAVNMRALEIYERIEKDYALLQQKKEDLGKERENVLVMINEVDLKKKEIFMRTYDVVNRNFKQLFKSLSSKGEATLELEDKKDVFSGGLMLKVRIVGKKFLDIRSLSGGEKTLTALAFIFAIQEHEPAPFYILDEVDAALDKKNSERLSKLVAEYANKAQYVMISHNDNVITQADSLYGISMNEHGVSKITSLKI